MNMFRKTSLMLGTSLPLMTAMGLCSIEDEGASEAASGGSSAGEGQPSAAPSQELSTAEKLEQEFYDPEEDEDDSGESAGGEEGAEGKKDDGDEGDGKPGAEEEPDPNAPKEPEAKKSSRAQERFDELTNTSRTHEREAAKWKAEAVKLGYSEDATETPTPEEPDPEKYAYGEHDPEYLKDRGKYDAKIEMLQGQAEARFKSEAAALDAKWTKNLAGAAESYPDFDEVVVKGADKWECPPVIAIAIKDSDVGPDIAYALAKDPAEASRIAKLSPLEQAREFGRKEVALTKDKEITSLKEEIATLKEAGAAPKPQPKKLVTKAPEPPKRRVSGGGARSEPNPDTDDFREFEKYADGVLKKN